MSQPPPGYPPGPQQPYPTQYGPSPNGVPGATQPQYGPPPNSGHPGYGSHYPGDQQFGPPLPMPPKRSRVGLVIAVVVGAVVLLGGAGLAALFVFGTKTLDPVSVQKEIVRVTQEAVHTAPTGATCPADIEVKSGTTFTCTAAVEGQPVTYSVTETDDKGNLTIKYDPLLEVAPTVDGVAKAASEKYGVPVTINCETGGKKVLVYAPNTPIHCTLVNKGDETDVLPITVTVDANGTTSYTADS